MDENRIKIACTDIPPVDELNKIVDDPNFIFGSELGFEPVTLFDIEGNSVVVRSILECAHYVNGGWSTQVSSNLNYFVLVGITALAGIILFAFNKFFLNIKIQKSILGKLKKRLTLGIKNKKLKKILFLIFLSFQQFYIFDYISIKSQRLKTFVDEYISLTSNVQFFNNLDFNAGPDWGGSYSIYLTSGPLSAVGSTIGWEYFQNFTYARIANYYWILIIQLLFLIFYRFYFNWNINFLLLMLSPLFLLIPWWQGILYSLGEVASIVIFINSCFVFQKSSKLAYFLIGFSIFFGKILTGLSFVGFFMFKLFSEKNIKKSLLDLIFFSIPLIIWLLLVSIYYKSGSVSEYIRSQADLILSHQSSGLEFIAESNNTTFLEKLDNSEYGNWNIYDKIRLSILPIVFFFILLKNRLLIDKTFNNLSLPLFGSALLPFLWFWGLSGTKWIRYSQHFTIIMIVSLIIFISKNIFTSKIDKIVIVLFIVLLFDDSKFLIYPILFFSLLFLLDKFNNQIYFKFIIITFITLNYFFPYTESENSYNVLTFDNCIENLLIVDCKNQYFNE